VRRLAEPERQRVEALFDMDELARFLPLPDHPISLEHGIADAYGRKLILGLMLWSKDHLT
jgi:hypothetical protein